MPVCCLALYLTAVANILLQHLSEYDSQNCDAAISIETISEAFSVFMVLLTLDDYSAV